MVIQGYIFSISYALLCILGAIGLAKLGVPKKYTRKFVHILVGFEWVILYRFMGAGVHFLAVCLIFLALLYIDYKIKLVPAMSSESENAPGTVYYALAMSIMAVATLVVPKLIYPFGIAVFCTSFGDGLAGVVGQLIKKCNPKIYGSKTLFGILTNLGISFLVPFCFDLIFNLNLEIYHCILISVFSTELELFVGRGLDNIVITLGVSAISYAFIYTAGFMNYILPVVITPLIIAFAYKKRALTLDGIFAAVLIDVLISVSLGNFGFTTLISFFVCSIIVDKFKNQYKKARQTKDIEREKKGDCRDAVQVLANGFIAALAATLYLFTKNMIFIFAFTAALAESFADTAASGVGVISKNVYDLFRLKKCDKGISGGMSVVGTLSSLIAAFLISLIPLAFGILDFVASLTVTAAAFLGAVFDSFIGSLFQIKYKCRVCGAIVETEEHCQEKTERHSGFKIITNDTVNFLGTAFSALLASFFSLI